MTRTFKKPEPEPHEETHGLPTHKRCIAYARQSTTKQVVENRESALYQTLGLLKRAYALGWSEELVTLKIEGQLRRDVEEQLAKDLATLEQQLATIPVKGVSGRLRIDEREGLSDVVYSIERDDIGAILVQNESRLFRDEFMVEVNTFIKACHDHGVLVITDYHTYDFRRPFDVKLFRMQCEAASDFVRYHVQGVLHPLRRQAALRGLYDGRPVAVGYIVCYDKASENYKKFIIYEPHAKVVRWIFLRYRELNGNFFQLGRELEQMGCVFPEFQGVKPAKTLLKKVPGGYGVTRNGLLSILTNPTYIGAWLLDGYIVIEHDNHEAIVDEEDFMYAFNRLSPHTLDGEENTERVKTAARYHQKGKPEAPALLKHVISTPGSHVYTVRYGQKWNYCITMKTRSFLHSHVETMIAVKTLDRIFVERLMHWLSAQRISRIWGYTQPNGKPLWAGVQTLENDMQEKLQEARSATAQESLEGKIADYKKQLRGKLATLDLPPEDLDQRDRALAAREAKQLRAIIDGLERKQKDAARVQEELEKGSDLLQRAVKDWNSFSLEEQKRFISLVTSRVELTLVAPHWFKFEIDWRGPISYTDVGYIFRSQSAELAWSEEENALLRSMYPTAERDDILARLPHRTWGAIGTQARKLRIARTNFASHSALPSTLTLKDAQFMESLRIPVTDDVGYGYVYWHTTTDKNAWPVQAIASKKWGNGSSHSRRACIGSG